ncbi:ATP-dependent DNA helicase [Trichonephila clavipes]|nr:ATP-dependent DNA helicase [Trichonephila clavipes]
MVKLLKILQHASSLCHAVKLSTLLRNFCPRCILTFRNTSRIRTGFLTEQFWQAEMMWLRSSMSPFRSSFPRQEYAYKSIDCILNDNEAVQYPIEFLNFIQNPDFQAHNLILKVGAPIMLILNIDAPSLCNGTRFIVKKLMQHVIKAKVLTGCAKGEEVFIPRIPIILSDNTIQFKRMQFPLKLCFSMTINKSQGQSLGIAGIDLKTPCFSHGQLYVACSRVGKNENLFVHTLNGTVKNVVYHIALR